MTKITPTDKLLAFKMSTDSGYNDITGLLYEIDEWKETIEDIFEENQEFMIDDIEVIILRYEDMLNVVNEQIKDLHRIFNLKDKK